ncbi:hypothetical protein WA026_003988 [Henosepilachna vigintioctopunctata]|uniref:Uncharacterized protein n=1 Tax=Henosepilachna vigintioctopunctata TaxID=420089 RepID=A0AAW1U894_9CUCU
MDHSIDKNFFYSKDNLVALHSKYDFWHMTATAGGHMPTCLSINQFRHELCDMLRRLIETWTSWLFNSGMKKLVIMALYRSPLTVTFWPSSFLKKYGPIIPPTHKTHQTVSFSGCNGVLTYTCRLSSLQMRQFWSGDDGSSSLNKIRAIRIPHRTMIFEIKLHYLQTLFRRESIHDELPNQTGNKSFLSC